MYLPEINRISQSRFSLSMFGGINRKHNVQPGELSEAVNMSADEYPLLITRQSYDVGLYQPFVAMWHNNDKDYAISKNHDVSENEDYYMITYNDGAAAYLPKDIKEFKNPVTANIGTSAVICDEINGMWVLELDKDTGRYSYNKVHSKYTVKNDYKERLGLNYISGGAVCHLRVLYEDGTYPTDFAWPQLDDDAPTQEKWFANYLSKSDIFNTLIHLGDVTEESVWVQALMDGRYNIVDNLIYRFCIPNADKFFKVGDYVRISNIKSYTVATPESTLYKDALSDDKILSELEGDHEIVNIVYTNDYAWAIDIKYKPLSKGFCTTMFTERGQFCSLKENSVGVSVYEIQPKKNDVYLADGMTIERKAPENVRFICSHQNRIWCNNGDNEIMCCARGNPYVWYKYEGNSLDSWAATVGGEGAFTGCINYGYPLFFKETKMYRINGTRPSNFGYTEYSMKGIKEGCHDSAVIVNDVLYYQGMDGIYAYGGSTPQKISDKVYRGRWMEGKACRYRDKYILCVNEGEEQSIYTYDTGNGLWHRERLNGGKVRYLYPGNFLHDHEEAVSIYTDVTESENYVTQFTTVLGRKEDVGGRDRTTLYAGYVITDDGFHEYDPEKPIEWEFETPELSDGYNYKYLKCVRIKFKPLESVELVVYRERDGEWRELDRVNAYNEKMYWYTRNFSVDRTSSIRLKLAGVGRVVIDKIILEFEEGSAEH